MATLIKILDKTKLQDKTVFAAPANEAPSLTTGLQAFYKLDDETDSSGNGNTLTNNGNVSFASGKIGNAAVFDGGNRFLSIAAPITSRPLTIAGWVKLNLLPTNQALFALQPSESSNSIMVYARDTAPYTMTAWVDGVEVFGTTANTVDSWIHVCGVFDSHTISVYKNGVLL